MDYSKIKIDEIRAADSAKRKEMETEIRQTMATKRMDVFSEKSKVDGEQKKLKRVLAQLLTVNSELRAKRA